MATTASKINLFTALKLPAAYFTGVRVESINNERCVTRVKHRWINQNPFNSMFWAVQGMAAELATGALVMAAIREEQKPVSMLVANNKARFSKKARGRIRFTCKDGLKIKEALAQTIATGEGQTCWMHATGVDEAGDTVSEFAFEWTVKVKSHKK